MESVFIHNILLTSKRRNTRLKNIHSAHLIVVHLYNCSHASLLYKAFWSAKFGGYNFLTFRKRSKFCTQIPTRFPAMVLQDWERKNFQRQCLEVKKEVINPSHLHIFTLDPLLLQLLRVLHNLFVFTNNLWPREVWKKWEPHLKQTSTH